MFDYLKWIQNVAYKYESQSVSNTWSKDKSFNLCWFCIHSMGVSWNGLQENIRMKHNVYSISFLRPCNLCIQLIISSISMHQCQHLLCGTAIVMYTIKVKLQYLCINGALISGTIFIQTGFITYERVSSLTKGLSAMWNTPVKYTLISLHKYRFIQA